MSTLTGPSSISYFFKDLFEEALAVVIFAEAVDVAFFVFGGSDGLASSVFGTTVAAGVVTTGAGFVSIAAGVSDSASAYPSKLSFSA